MVRFRNGSKGSPNCPPSWLSQCLSLRTSQVAGSLLAYINDSSFYAAISPSVRKHDAIHPLHYENQNVFYSDSYLNDQYFIPTECWNVLSNLPDYRHALERKRGVLYEVLKRLLGYRLKKVNLPTPVYYHYFAYTAAALVAGDRKKMTWRSFEQDSLLTAADVVYCIERHGIYGAYDEENLSVDVSPFARHKAVFARMFNVDHRFGRRYPGDIRMENFVLAVDDDARPPTPGYCPHCQAIDVYWENKTYKPTMVGEDLATWQDLMNAYDFLRKRKIPFTGTPDNSEFVFTMFDVVRNSSKHKNHFKLTPQDIGDYAN